MMHPATEIRPTGIMGVGVFATEFIPRGTIVYVRDPLEKPISTAEFMQLPPVLRRVVDVYSYIDPDGTRVLSWDLAKYVNHRCECNTLSTGWGFEIAVEDIFAGDEITDDYGLFNLEEPMPLACGCVHCRGFVLPDDFQRCGAKWDARVQSALPSIPLVNQPLWELVDTETKSQLDIYLAGSGDYRSVRSLQRTGTDDNPQPQHVSL